MGGWCAVLFLIVTVAVFWRSDLFFIKDDWTELDLMSRNPPWHYIALPNGEVWFPIFHAVFYLLVRLFGPNYAALVLVNCLGTGLNAFMLYVLLGRHWRRSEALLTSLFYGAAAVHTATIWNAFYLCYIMSLGFLLAALLLTDSYFRSPSGPRLAGVAICSWLSVLSHNYTLLALPLLALYGPLTGLRGIRSRVLAVAATVGVVLVVFASGYVLFAGRAAATFHDAQLLSRWPGATFPQHWFYGSFVAPCLYLIWGHFHFPVMAYVGGITLLAGCVAALTAYGSVSDRKWLCWALLFNALPFVLVSFTRYHRSPQQAFVSRYAVFTLIGALILAGTAWRVVSARLPRSIWHRIFPVCVLGILLVNQLISHRPWKRDFLECSRAARDFYEGRQVVQADPVLRRPADQFWLPDHHPLTPADAARIRRFLEGGIPNP